MTSTWRLAGTAVGALLLLDSCSTPPGSSTETETGTGTETEATSESSSASEGDSAPSVDTTTDGSATATNGSTDDGPTDDGPTDDGSTDDSGTTGTTTEPGCPASLPADWILCEDFEAVGDPSTYFAFFWTTDGLMDVESADAWSGERALRIGHDPAVFNTGMADIRFGQGTEGGLIHAPDQTFREVWVRFHLRTDAAWPDAGIAEAVEVMSVSGPSRAIAVDATIYSPSQPQAQALAWSCVHESDLWCDGGDDWSNPALEVRSSGLGTSELYGTAAAGQWQCHEIHVRLDDPGAGNGEFEVFVDDQLEVSLTGITFVDAWAGAGLNNVRFGSFWNSPAVLEHHVDDVVVSTAPIGCR